MAAVRIVWQDRLQRNTELVGDRAGHLLPAQWLPGRAEPGSHFIDDVDRFIGKKTVGDVAPGQLDCRHERFIGDPAVVVPLQ
jgi:hypothetical protein